MHATTDTDEVQGWPDFIQRHLAARAWDKITLARVADVDKSMVGRWLRGEADPAPESVRRVARVFRRPLRECLVIAGLYTEKEMYHKGPQVPDVKLLTDEQLMDEIRERMKARELRVPHPPADSEAGVTQNGVQVLEASEHTNRPSRRRRAPDQGDT